MMQRKTLCKLFAVLTVAMLLAVGLSRSAPVAQAQTDTTVSINQISNQASTVFVEGDYAYIGVGSRMIIVDISNPANPTQVSQSSMLADIVKDIYVSGSYAYVVDNAGGFHGFDISNPANPTLTGTYTPPTSMGSATGVTVSSSYVYIVYFNGLHVLDINNPANPILMGSYNASSNFYDVAVSGNYAYIAGGSSGVLVFDISTPAAPKKIGSYDIYDTNSVAINGSYAYVTYSQYGGTSGLHVLDISTPANPILTGIYDTINLARNVAVGGSYAYVVDADSGLHILDISNPATPTLTSNYNNILSISDVAISGNYAYLTAFYEGLQIIDISNPGTPTLVGSYDPLSTTTPTPTTTPISTPTPITTTMPSTITPTSTITTTPTTTPMGTPTITPTSTITATPIATCPAVSMTMTTEGGTLTGTNQTVSVTFPPGAVTGTNIVTLTRQTTTPPADYVDIQRAFTIEATTPNGQPVTQFNEPLIIIIHYQNVDPAVEETLQLYWFNGNSWVTTGLSSMVDVDAKRVIGTTDHLTLFAVFGDSSRNIYLPLLTK